MEEDDQLVALRDARSRFIAAFPAQLGSYPAPVDLLQQSDTLAYPLMVPKMTGFDVLHPLQGLTDKPRVIVLSARGREQDVTRAFVSAPTTT